MPRRAPRTSPLDLGPRRWSSPGVSRLALVAVLLSACFTDPGLPDTSTGTTTTDTAPTTTTTTSAGVSCSDGLEQGAELCDAGPLNGPYADCREDCSPAECGDGFASPAEFCDDGNALDNDGCRNDCTFGVCGDGVVLAEREECDDGNDAENDACASNCTLPACGNGVIETGEECDWGVLGGDDKGCTAACKAAFCGDGLVGPGEGCDDPEDMNCVGCRVMTCGNGMPDPGEPCDDGNEVNTDACLNTCVPATCGDGVVQGGGEACDDGNPFDGDACNTACEKVQCGDGKAVVGEACDDGNKNPGDGCSDECQRDARFVFVTDQKFKASLGGLEAGADAKCQAAAAEGKLPGTYRAWMSDSDASPATRFSRAQKPYILPGPFPPVVVADSWAGLVSGTLKHPINRNSAGVELTFESSCGNTDAMAWTHTKATGGPYSGSPCSDWLVSTDVGTAVAGLIGEHGLSWTEGCPTIACNMSLRLYCVEQP